MDGKKPYFVVLLIQTIYAGMALLSKAAFNGGMNSFVFIFYRQAAATVVLVPLAIILERKRAPPLTFVIFCKIFMLSLFGVTICLNVYGIGLIYTSATLAAATSNTIPVITFLVAVLLGKEVVNLRRLSGIAKIIGVVLFLAGAVILALYKGPHLKPVNHQLLGHPSSNSSSGSSEGSSSGSSKTWIKGCLLMLTSNILWGLWAVLQAAVIKSYPSKLLFTTLQCFLSAIQSLVVAFAFERNFHEWHLRFDVGLIAIAYSGIVVTGVAFYLQAWCIQKKGPVFLSMATPLSFLITIISSAFLLGELITLGSVLGGMALVGGLYCVLWGKSKEQNKKPPDTLTIEDGQHKELKDCRSDGTKLGIEEEEIKGSNAFTEVNIK